MCIHCSSTTCCSNSRQSINRFTCLFFVHVLLPNVFLFDFCSLPFLPRTIFTNTEHFCFWFLFLVLLRILVLGRFIVSVLVLNPSSGSGSASCSSFGSGFGPWSGSSFCSCPQFWFQFWFLVLSGFVSVFRLILAGVQNPCSYQVLVLQLGSCYCSISCTGFSSYFDCLVLFWFWFWSQLYCFHLGSASGFLLFWFCFRIWVCIDCADVWAEFLFYLFVSISFRFWLWFWLLSWN